MRRLIILALLFFGMQLIIPLGGAHGAQSESLLIFGFLVLAAYSVGELSSLLTLPKITGYMIAGILFGPWMLGTVSPGVIEELSPVSQLAIALIAFLAGAELRLDELRQRGRAIVMMLGAELVLSFLVIVGILFALRGAVPFFEEADNREALVLAGLFAAVAIVHSPAVVMALLTETRARGPVARTTLGIVLVADVVVVVLFSGALALTRAVVPAPGGEALSAGTVAWEIGGSVLVGGLLGGAVALYLRFVQRELLMFAVVVAFFGAEIAQLAHVETLLTLLVAGFVTENATPGDAGRDLLHAMERSAAPVFVVFFALAGASIALGELAVIWPLALAVVVARALAVWGGCVLGARWSGAGVPEQRYVWMGLIAQAGVAIGLVTVVADAYPARGAQMRTLFLSVIAINQIVGPVLARWALARSGEAGPAQTAAAPASATPRVAPS